MQKQNLYGVCASAFCNESIGPFWKFSCLCEFNLLVSKRMLGSYHHILLMYGQLQDLSKFRLCEICYTAMHAHDCISNFDIPFPFHYESIWSEIFCGASLLLLCIVCKWMHLHVYLHKYLYVYLHKYLHVYLHKYFASR